MGCFALLGKCRSEHDAWPADPPIDPDDSLSEQLNRACTYFVSEGRFFNRLDHMEVFSSKRSNLFVAFYNITSTRVSGRNDPTPPKHTQYP